MAKAEWLTEVWIITLLPISINITELEKTAKNQEISTVSAVIKGAST